MEEVDFVPAVTGRVVEIQRLNAREFDCRDRHGLKA
jgi:hypothetical protein